MHSLNVRVYYEDTDAGGVVYYANYLKFCERARTEFLRELGYEQDRLLEQNIAFVVKHVDMSNIAPARFNDLLSIHTQIVELKGASIMFEQNIKNQQQQLLVAVKIQVVCVDIQKMRAKKIPHDLVGDLSRVI